MKPEHLSSSSATRRQQLDPGDVPTSKPGKQKVRSARLHSAHRAHAAPTDDDGAHLPATDAQRLLLVQEGRVVCVVEHHRHDSALSVARLLCRLRLGEAFVYACPAADADRLRPDQQVEHVPETWQEVYRATPWAEPMIDGSYSLPVVGIH